MKLMIYAQLLFVVSGTACGTPYIMLRGKEEECWTVRHAEQGSEEGRQSFTDWRTVLSANSRIWGRGSTKERHSQGGMPAGRREGAVIDASWIVHLPKLIVW